MLSCLLEPTAGDAWVMGHSVRSESLKVKAAIGVVPQVTFPRFCGQG
jgi:ABC-2 type transport system ATP-binding protein